MSLPSNLWRDFFLLCGDPTSNFLELKQKKIKETKNTKKTSSKKFGVNLPVYKRSKLNPQLRAVES